MARLLKQGDLNPEVKKVQTLLEKDYVTNAEINAVDKRQQSQARRIALIKNINRWGAMARPRAMRARTRNASGMSPFAWTGCRVSTMCRVDQAGDSHEFLLR